MININNDDIGVTSSNKISAIERVSPVKEVSTDQQLPGSGNNLPADVAASQQGENKSSENAEKLNEAVKVLNEEMQVVKRELHFSVDEDSGTTVIKVMDLSTKEVIRQIPNEEALSVARTLSDGADLKLFSSYT